jgi:hypothetical protein
MKTNGNPREALQGNLMKHPRSLLPSFIQTFFCCFCFRVEQKKSSSFSHLILFICYITIVWKFTINQCWWLSNLQDREKNLHQNETNCLCVAEILTLHESSKTNYERKWLLIYLFGVYINYGSEFSHDLVFIRCNENS